MKRKIVTLFAIIVAASFSAVYAQTEAEMKAWMEFMSPGDIHKMIAKSDGKWKAESTMWMAPNTAPQKMDMDVENKMILGGRYQQSSYSGSFNGMPFEGISTLAWDNGKKVFISTWIDNMGTGIAYLEGTWDAKNNMINLLGKQTDPMTGKEMKIRETLKITDDDTQVMEMFNPGPDGKEFKNMEVKLTRKK